MTEELKYLVIYEKSGWPRHPIATVIPDGAYTDIESALGWAEDISEDIIGQSVHILNTDDYWRGYFFYNDMEGPEAAEPLECNSREHLDAHWETNNSSGHYDCTKYEHIVNGNIIETIKQDEQESECN